jgi:hypothetical protein
MRRRLHTVLVYFGLSEDPELDARLRERERSDGWHLVGGTMLLMLAVAAFWGLLRIVGIDNDLAGLALAEGMLLLFMATGLVVVDGETLKRRSPWREWAGHLAGITGLWSLVLLIATLLGFRIDADTLGTYAAWMAGITLIDAVSFAWRFARRRSRAA